MDDNVAEQIFGITDQIQKGYNDRSLICQCLQATGLLEGILKAWDSTRYL